MLVWLLCRDRGSIRAVAKGGRASRKRFPGALEPFALLDASLERGRGTLMRLKETRLIEPHLGLAGDLERLDAAARVVRLLLRIAPEERQEAALFDTAVSVLSALAQPGTTSVRSVELWARLALLRCAGLEVSATRCAGCAVPVPVGRKVYFHPMRGGVVCTPCGGGPVLLTATVAQLLAESSCGIARQPLAQDVESLHRSLDSFIEWHVVRFGQDAMAC